jgi:toxin CptA
MVFPISLRSSTSLTASVPTITFDYRPSSLLLSGLFLLTGLVLLAICDCAAVLPIKAVLAISALIYAAHTTRRLTRAPWTHMTWHSQGHWRLHGEGDDMQAAELMLATRIGGLLVLRFRLRGQRRFDAILLPDNLDADTRRRLRVRLARGDSAEVAAQ